MNTQIAGHSGCVVKIVREADGLTIHKLSYAQASATRLLRQANKQQTFLKNNQLSFITTPRILRLIEDQGNSGIVMEYIHAKSFVDYFENASYLAPRIFAKHIIEFLEDEFAKSPLSDVPSTLLSDKFLDVSRIIKANPILASDEKIAEQLERAAQVFLTPRTRRWPVGICHGDLTLSNILFQEGRLYLIDFLDSFIETPLMDIVKLRQDTRHRWSQMMVQGEFDRVKNTIVLYYIDKLLWERFKHEPSIQDGYCELQCLSFLRILQYAKEKTIIEYLKRNLDILLQECGV